MDRLGAAVVEIDDWPWEPERTIRALDECRAEWPGFRATVFTIPGLMTPELWQPLLERQEWLEVCPHSFMHCRSERRWRGSPAEFGDRLLGMMGAWPWTRVFKPLRYCWRRKWAAWLGEQGWGLAARRGADVLDCWPSPLLAPAGLRLWRKYESGPLNCYAHISNTPFLHKDSTRSEWRRRIALAGNKFMLVSECLAPLRRLYLGAGDHVLPGFIPLDHRRCTDATILWRFGEPLPCPDEGASVGLVQNSLMYSPKESYLATLRDIRRTLCAGGVLVIKEDDDRVRVWRELGHRHADGQVLSTSNQAEMEALLAEAGFLVVQRTPKEHLALHGELINRQRRVLRGSCYMAEGRKPAEPEP